MIYRILNPFPGIRKLGTDCDESWAIYNLTDVAMASSATPPDTAATKLLREPQE